LQKPVFSPVSFCERTGFFILINVEFFSMVQNMIDSERFRAVKFFMVFYTGAGVQRRRFYG